MLATPGFTAIRALRSFVDLNPMGVQPGAPLTEADMIGVRACGGLSVVLATGLIVEAA